VREIKITISWRSLLAVGAAVLGAYILIQLWFILLVVVMALVIAGTLLPAVRWLEARRLPPSVALAIVFLGLVAALILLGLATLPTLYAQVIAFIEKAPALQERLADWLSHNRVLAPLARTVRNEKASELIAHLGAWAVDASQTLAVFMGYAATTVVLALYILAGRRGNLAALYALIPVRHHPRTARILKNLEDIVGGYVRGQFVTSALMVFVVWVLLTTFDAPNPIALAIFAGIADVLPFIGGLLVTTPVVLDAAQKGVAPAVVVLVVMIVYQEVESRILVPRIYGRALRLSSSAVIIALLIGGSLLGVLGALLALPIAAAIRMIINDVREEREAMKAGAGDPTPGA
jgi:predicted PurR-regulated permease PerM